MKPGDKPWTEAETDYLAQVVSEGHSLSDAARGLGRSRDSIKTRWNHICRKLGPQAR